MDAPSVGTRQLAGMVGADDWAADGKGALEACQRASGLGPQRHVNDVTREMVNPLESMLGLAALLQEDTSLTHRQRDLASRIIKAGGQLMTGPGGCRARSGRGARRP